MSNKKRKLLFKLTKVDFKIETFRGRGPGGQHRNKRDSCVRITHPQSGAVSSATESRRQNQNRALAFKRLCESPKFKAWLKLEVARRQNPTVDIHKRVDEMMSPENIRVELWDGNKWVEEGNSGDRWKGGDGLLKTG